MVDHLFSAPGSSSGEGLRLQLQHLHPIAVADIGIQGQIKIEAGPPGQVSGIGHGLAFLEGEITDPATTAAILGDMDGLMAQGVERFGIDAAGLIRADHHKAIEREIRPQRRRADAVAVSDLDRDTSSVKSIDQLQVAGIQPSGASSRRCSRRRDGSGKGREQQGCSGRFEQGALPTVRKGSDRAANDTKSASGRGPIRSEYRRIEPPSRQGDAPDAAGADHLSQDRQPVAISSRHCS
ncbi:hypothetical protein SynRS9907_01951 [Synechococcus sp. RS9907]|nr:hypothetical protein SynRS9907_01951 [Synechococcus sp. RS9907]